MSVYYTHLNNEELIALGRSSENPLERVFAERLADLVDHASALEEVNQELEGELEGGAGECSMCEDLNAQVERLQETVKKLQRLEKKDSELLRKLQGRLSVTVLDTPA